MRCMLWVPLPKGKRAAPNHQPQSLTDTETLHYTFCNKWGHITTKCFNKPPYYYPHKDTTSNPVLEKGTRIPTLRGKGKMLNKIKEGRKRRKPLFYSFKSVNRLKATCRQTLECLDSKSKKGSKVWSMNATCHMTLHAQCLLERPK